MNITKRETNLIINALKTEVKRLYKCMISTDDQTLKAHLEQSMDDHRALIKKLLESGSN